MKYLWYLLLFVWVLTSCTKDEPVIVPKVEIQFQNVVGLNPLVLNSSKYLSPANDTFTVSQFRYYISNVVLYGKNGKTYTESKSYHLITQGEKLSFQLNSVPQVGTYDSFTFDVGIDSTHNHSIDAIGDLDPNNNMVWDWNTGYKFLLLEGNYMGNTMKGSLVFHIGGDQNLRKISLSGPFNVAYGKTTTIKIKTDINEMFISPNAIDFDNLHEAMFGPAATTIANNYADGMFSIITP